MQRTDTARFDLHFFILYSYKTTHRYRTNPSEIIPSPHRLAVAQLLVQNSKLLSVDPWEITRRRAMDYLSLLEHTQAIIGEQFPGSLRV